ncbi:MAG: hypothetical protein JWO78_1234 [Micavibrio sp.]|nr:hypothetical protein [Micavibrio sp.]
MFEKTAHHFENAAQPPAPVRRSFNDVRDLLVLSNLKPQFVPLIARAHELIDTYFDHPAEEKAKLKALLILDNGDPFLFKSQTRFKLFGGPTEWNARDNLHLRDTLYDLAGHIGEHDIAHIELAIDVANYEKNLQMMRDTSAREAFFKAAVDQGTARADGLGTKHAVVKAEDRRTCLRNALVSKYTQEVLEHLIIIGLETSYEKVPRMVKRQSELGTEFMRLLAVPPPQGAEPPVATNNLPARPPEQYEKPSLSKRILAQISSVFCFS